VHVGLNLCFLVPGETGGMEIYVRALVPALRRARQNLRLTLICSPELAEELEAEPWCEGLEVIRLSISGRSRVRRVLAEQTLVASAAKRAGVEVIHSPGTTAPLWTSSPSVITLHDLIYASIPESHPGALSYGMRVLVPLSVRSAERVIVLSEYVRDEAVDRLRASRERIDVIPHGPGVDSGARPTPESELRARYGLGQRKLVLSVSARRPHKNLERLVDAMRDVPGDPLLVLPGYPGPHDETLRRRGGDRVRVLGWISDADLEGLYAAAACMVFPSLSEGFGLPVLEAMRRGVPVACSNASSLPEVAGDAALLFEPREVAAIAGAVRRLLEDRELAASMAARGPERATHFSWRRAAELTLDSYDRAVSDSGRARVG
jgi:glycosyltransferase involved in cell wall biosynthesis